MDESKIAHHEAVVNGVRLHWVEAGSGPLVVLLHGFPEFWYSWRKQIPALVDAGYRVVAPDQRGYNTSEKPKRVRAYRIEHLAADIAALVKHRGESKAAIVGHDWGGAVAWAIPVLHPDVVDRLVVLNGPHPAAFERELKTFDQLSRSWYIAFFQLPWLPELAISTGDFAAIGRMLRRDALEGSFDREAVRRYKDALREPGALTAALNWYRAAGRRGPWGMRGISRPIRHKTMLIWGMGDRHLTSRLTEGLEPWVPDLRVERIPDATHWVQNDRPERVNELLIDFLR